MMLNIATKYIKALGSEDLAIERFARDLMRGDSETFKAGYSRENAIIATAEAFDVPRTRVEAIMSCVP